MALMDVIEPPAEEGEGEGTDFVALVNRRIDICKEVFDSLHKLGRSVCQRSPSDMQCTIVDSGNHADSDQLKQRTCS